MKLLTPEIEKKKMQETVEVVMKVIDRWYVYSSKKPTDKQRYALGRMVLNLYRIPFEDIHEAWESFREADLAKQKELNDDQKTLVFEYWMSKKVDWFDYVENVVLRMDYRTWYLRWQDKGEVVLVCAKEVPTDNKIWRTDVFEISKVKYPKTFSLAKKRLRPRWYN